MPKGVPNKRYTPEYKAMVIETMQKEHMGYNEAMRAFGITARRQIQKMGEHLPDRRSGRPCC